MLSKSSNTRSSAELTDATEPRRDEERLAFLALASIKGVGQKTLEALANTGSGFRKLFAIDESGETVKQLRVHGARIDGSVAANWRRVREQASERGRRLLDAFERDGTSIIFRHESKFPRALLDLPDPPPWLFVKGNPDVLHRPSVAIVGTREPSDDGRFLGRYVGACLPAWGVPTVSGLAVGIDQQVHELSHRAKVPTIAVLGTGILSDYPRGAVGLRDTIVDNGGAMITEYLPNESYSAEHFVRRNRLQAALGHVLIPVEWNPRSGTAHTVRFATMLRRPIAFLRLSDWETGRVMPSKGMGHETGRIFTIPGEEAAFRQYVHESISRPVPSKPQLSLFTSDRHA